MNQNTYSPVHKGAVRYILRPSTKVEQLSLHSRLIYVALH